jgi:hypothetical protein
MNGCLVNGGKKISAEKSMIAAFSIQPINESTNRYAAARHTP